MGAFRFDANGSDAAKVQVTPTQASARVLKSLAEPMPVPVPLPVPLPVPGQLYGYLSRPKEVGASSHAVLLCNPFGQEAIRTHRLYRVLAERLARNGIACLRFDYYGSGDSDGDDQSFGMQTCVDNVLRADQELRALTGCTYVSWFGLRFGAAVAAQASTLAKNRPDRLFLWDPLEDGSASIAQWQQEHQQAVQVLLSSVRSRARADISPHEPPSSEGAFESQGFMVSAPFHEALRRVSPATYQRLGCSRLVVLAAGPEQRQRLQGLENNHDILSFEIEEVERTQWNSDEAMNAALVPNDVVSRVLREMAGGGR
jgi:uncharacterized protein